MSYNPFQTILDESHLKPGTKLKKGDEELEVVKPVGDDKYLVKEENLDEAPDHTMEAHGVKGMKNTPWRKTFKSHDHAREWAEKNDADIHGTRDLEQAKKGNLSPAIKEEVTDESMVVRTQNGRKMVSAEVAIRLAREIAARRKEGEKATTTDLKHATKALRREETEQIDELSSDTLKSYANKRRDQIKDRFNKLMAKSPTNKEIADYNSKTKKDLENINKAGDKVAYKRQGSRADRDGD